jgi:hypothetical protein
VPARDFTSAAWSLGQWDVLDGLKVNGAGSGFFEYTFDLPTEVLAGKIVGASFLVEVSAKELLGKDKDDSAPEDSDYMRGKGFHDPAGNPNAYPMTDERTHPGAVRITINGVRAGLYELPDDPADHRGILSWHSQLGDRRLREAGSYGYRIVAPVPDVAVRKAASTGALVVRLEVEPSLPGGLAVYGARFGRYPMDPTIVLTLE